MQRNWLSATEGWQMEQIFKIKVQQAEPLPLEISFPKLVFDKRIRINDDHWKSKGKWQNYKNGQSVYSGTKGDEISLNFEGSGISIVGNWFKDGGKADIYLDGKFVRTIDCYFFYSNQQHQNMSLFHLFNLEDGKHIIRLVVKGEKRPESIGTNVYISEAVIFKTHDKTNENYRFSFQQ